jgi:hypothetical protein
MNATGYIINAILVLLVLRQIRESRLDLISLVLPVALVAGAAAYYLRAVPAAGNDIALDLTLAATGAALGIGCAMATRMRRGGDGVALARAGGVAAVLWVAGIGSRMAFAFFLRPRRRAGHRAVLCCAQHHQRGRLGGGAGHHGPDRGHRPARRPEAARPQAPRGCRRGRAADAGSRAGLVQGARHQIAGNLPPRRRGLPARKTSQRSARTGPG